MTRKMTVVLHDEELYTSLKVEAARSHRTASDIVAEAVREWLERLEDRELLPLVQAAEREWKQKGGRPWTDVRAEAQVLLAVRERPPKNDHVPD